MFSVHKLQRRSRFFLLVAVFCAAVSGCFTREVRTTPEGWSQAASATPAAPTPTPTRPVPSLTPGPVAAEPSPRLSPTPLLPTARPPSGWTVFTNPDFVEGVEVHDRHLWAATLGGVVVWDLVTEEPVLYTPRDGLVEIQSNDIVYCPVPQEQILVAHETGVLSAFDLASEKWSRIPISFDDGGTFNGVQTIFCDAKNNRLLVGSGEGLGILDLKNGRWKRIGPEEGLRVETIRAIDVVGMAIWIAAGDQSAFLIMGNTIFPFNGASGFPSGPVNDLSVAPDSSIWFAYPTGLVHYLDKKWNSYGGQTPAGIPFVSVDHVEVGPERTIWIASADEGICPFNQATLFCSTVYPGIRGAPVTDLVVDSNGVAYAGTRGRGVVVLRPDDRRNLAFGEERLLSNDVLDVAQDAQGRLWVATSLGINIIDPSDTAAPWQTILPERNGLRLPRVSGLLPTAEGMWIYYDQATLASFFDGETWLHLDARKGISGNILDAAVDQRGYVWFATERGLDIWDGVAMRSYGPETGLQGEVFHALFQDGDEMWVGADSGLLQYEQYRWVVRLPGLAVQAIAPDPSGKLLLGTDQGLVRFDGSQSFEWLVNLGEEVLTNPSVTSIAWDGTGGLWAGTDGEGLLRYQNGRWERFDTVRGMPTNHIRKLYTGGQGEVWIVATTGQGGGALVRFVP